MALSAEEHHRTGTIKLTHQIAKDHVGGETSQIMTQAGIDFPVLLQRSLDGDLAAIRLLLWTSDNVGLDGAASEGYATALVDVAKKIGDAKLVSAVKDLKMESYETIRFCFLDRFGVNSPDKKIAKSAEQKVVKLFPKFWKMAKNRN